MRTVKGDTLNPRFIMTKRSGEVTWWLLFSRQSVPKVPKLAISENQGSNLRNLVKIGMKV